MKEMEKLQGTWTVLISEIGGGTQEVAGGVPGKSWHRPVGLEAREEVESHASPVHAAPRTACGSK
jgi:hypothetical protein